MVGLCTVLLNHHSMAPDNCVGKKILCEFIFHFVDFVISINYRMSGYVPPVKTLYLLLLYISRIGVL